MKALAEWRATQPGTTPFRDTHAMACELAGVFVVPAALRTLLQRTDWITYWQDVEVDILLRIRKKLERRAEDYLDAHYEAMTAARQKGEYDKIPALANPVLDRIWPKKEEAAQVAHTIIVQMPASSAVPALPAGLDHSEDADILEITPAPHGQSSIK